MRITNSMMVNQFLSDSNDALVRVSKYQSQVDSTKRINNIADDPQSTITALKARNKLSNLALYKTNISTASSYLREAESVTGELNEILQSAYENIISAHTGVKGQDDLNTIAEDLKNLQNEVLSISNTSMGTSYIFGGYNYTGSTVGSTKNPPFTTDPVTGDLFYNGINVSQFAWNDEYSKQTTNMAAERTTFDDIADAFDTASPDDYNKSQAQSALDAVNKLLAHAEEALDDAVQFGVNPSTSTGYDDLKTFYDNLTAAASQLSVQVSKELDGGDPFDSTATKNELDNIKNLLAGTPAPSMSDAVTGLATEMSGTLATPQAALDNETGKTTTLQIGVSQTVDVTLTGLDLLGSGSDNIYHLLGKAVSMLQNGASPDQMSSLITSFQDAMANVRNLETGIGASQNRLTLISNRYDLNEMNYTQMRSDSEDVDMAEAIMNLTTAQTVYNAALAGGSELIKTSLIDFLR